MAAAGLASLFPIDELAIIGFTAIRGAAAANPAPHPGNRRGGDQRETRRARHHRQPRFHPSRGARACAGARRGSRSSITSRHRSGPGGPGGRARCAPMSITCWRCCRSSPRCTNGSAGRPAVYVGHPLVEEVRRSAARRRGERDAGSPIRRLSWCCPAAAAARSGGCSAYSARRSRDCGIDTVRSTSCCRPCRIWPGACVPPLTGLAGAAAHRHRSRGKAGGVSRRARGARQIRHRDARTGACRRADRRRLQGSAVRGNGGAAR